MAKQARSQRRRVAAAHASNTRVLPIPADLFHELEDMRRERRVLRGEPDVLGTRLVYGGVVLLVVLVLLGLAAGVGLQDGWGNAHGHETTVVVLCVLLFGLLSGLIAVLLRGWRQAGQGFLEIDAQQLSWGREAQVPDACIDWADVRRARTGAYDVRTDFATSESLTRALVFELPGASPQENRVFRLPLRLTVGNVRVLRFHNQAQLLRAILLHLATQPVPRLRFDAQVFVDAGVDPQTWLPMRAPRRWYWAASGLAVLPAVVLIVLWPAGESLGWEIAALLAALLAGAGAAAWFMHQRYPGLQGVFEFEPPPPRRC